MKKTLTLPVMAVLALSLCHPQLAQAQTYSQTEVITYHDNTTKWVLGQVSKRVVGGVTAEETTYSSNAQPLTVKSFGKLQQTLTYNTDGTVKTVKDGNNNVTTLSNWKRGIPQSIQHADGKSQASVVDNNGWISSVTDENGYKTCYAYDAMGRISQITSPSESTAGICDTSTWNATTQAFVQVNSAEYGIAAGHWRQTISTGNARKITYYDGLWRPLLTREYDTANESGTKRFQKFAYDHEGRVTFASYPGSSDALSTGTWTEYDALGRVTSVSQDSELSAGLLVSTTEYLSGFKTRVTDPKGNQTTTSYMAYDQPGYDWPVTIAHPQGAYTHITRDSFGKPTKIRRSNSSSATGGSVAVDRSYSYNSNQELCRTVEPESGATLMGYDGAGNLKWSAAGLGSSQACEASGTSTAVAARRVDRTYDARNRLGSLAFPDGKGDQAWTYTADGLPANITTTVEGSARVVTNLYTYNRRRLLVGETQQLTSWGDYKRTLAYNANGHLSSVSANYSAPTLAYAPNALGQPTTVGTFATGISYYPNGAIKSFTYGNGIVHTMTQNARQLPSRSTDCTTTGTCSTANKRLDLSYSYDENGNVAQIVDNTNGRQTRGMSYDGLDRLVQTTSNMFGTATYTYDPLDNLTRAKLSGGDKARDHYYCYSNNRLSNVKTGSCAGSTVVGLEYDVQGNLKNKSGQLYSFDYGNRLRETTGKESEYHYDGYGRRAMSRRLAVESSVMRSVYAQDGQLVFVQDQGQALRKDYIYLGNSLLAERKRPNTAAEPVTVVYQHTDALGTPTATTDASKNIADKFEYEPYGQLVNGTLKTGPGYTGHMQDAATGLTYMQQRYMDPALGVFLSTDPITAYSNPVGQFHRYRYANNNPYRFKDPDGRKCATADGKDSCTFDEFKDKKGNTISREQATSGGSKLAKFFGADRGSRIQRAEAGMTAKYTAAKNLAAKGGQVTIKGNSKLGIPDQKIGASTIVSRMETRQTIANESSNPENSNSIASVKADLITGGPANSPINYWKDGSAGSDMAQVFGHEILHTIYSGIGVPNNGYSNPNIDHQAPFDDASDDIR